MWETESSSLSLKSLKLFPALCKHSDTNVSQHLHFCQLFCFWSSNLHIWLWLCSGTNTPRQARSAAVSGPRASCLTPWSTGLFQSETCSWGLWPQLHVFMVLFCGFVLESHVQAFSGQLNRKQTAASFTLTETLLKRHQINSMEINMVLLFEKHCAIKHTWEEKLNDSWRMNDAFVWTLRFFEVELLEVRRIDRFLSSFPGKQKWENWKCADGFCALQAGGSYLIK